MPNLFSLIFKNNITTPVAYQSTIKKFHSWYNKNNALFLNINKYCCLKLILKFILNNLETSNVVYGKWLAFIGAMYLCIYISDILQYFCLFLQSEKPRNIPSMVISNFIHDVPITFL
jgi:hypothetical protein